MADDVALPAASGSTASSLLGVPVPRQEGQVEGAPPTGGRRRRRSLRLWGFVRRHLVLGLVLLAGVGLGSAYLLSTAPSVTPVLDQSVLVDLEGSAVDVVGASVEVELADSGAAQADIRLNLFCEGTGPVSAEFLPSDPAGLAYAPEEPDEPVVHPPLGDAAATRGDEGALLLSGNCTSGAWREIRVTGSYREETLVVPVARGRYAFAFELFQLFDLDESAPMYAIVRPPDGALIEETYGEDERSLNRATWTSDDLNVTASGTYVVPGEVARAQWLDDGLLLLLGALAGLAVEAFVRLGAGRRRARERVGG